MMHFFQKLFSRPLWWIAACVILLSMLPFMLSESWTSIATEIIIMSLAACALNLMLGYAGMVSFGPAGLYAVGAYGTALVMTKTSAPFIVSLIAGPVLAGAVGCIVGWFCVRRSAVYFALLTLAFAQIIWTIIFEWYGFTGGDNGIVGLPTPDILFPIRNSYYFSLLIVLVALFVLWRIINSPFGKTLQAIRENPNRVEFIGANVKRYQLAAFVISSTFLGIAGSLYGVFSGSVFPDYAYWIKSTDMLIVCLLGGIYTFVGPIVGSVIYILLSKIIAVHTMYWMLFLGMIVVFLVLFMRNGIAGFVSDKLDLSPQSDKDAREVTE